jgi:hypothetical protein
VFRFENKCYDHEEILVFWIKMPFLGENIFKIKTLDPTRKRASDEDDRSLEAGVLVRGVRDHLDEHVASGRLVADDGGHVQAA